jgi:hypothetical protein
MRRLEVAREVFRRSKKSADRKLSVSIENVVRRTLVDPGDYLCSVKKAELREPRRDGNLSVILDLVDPESGEYFDIRPLWVDGPNASRGTMAGRNVRIVCDMLDVIGVPPDSYKAITDELLARLVGHTLDLDLDVDRGGRGGVFNTIVRVNGKIDPADVVPLPNPAAD